MMMSPIMPQEASILPSRDRASDWMPALCPAPKSTSFREAVSKMRMVLLMPPVARKSPFLVKVKASLSPRERRMIFGSDLSVRLQRRIVPSWPPETRTSGFWSFLSQDVERDDGACGPSGVGLWRRQRSETDEVVVAAMTRSWAR